MGIYPAAFRVLRNNLSTLSHEHRDEIHGLGIHAHTPWYGMELGGVLGYDLLLLEYSLPAMLKWLTKDYHRRQWEPENPLVGLLTLLLTNTKLNESALRYYLGENRRENI